jgi:HAD superfamily 5'-nucleotidase-like hydrolase
MSAISSIFCRHARRSTRMRRHAHRSLSTLNFHSLPMSVSSAPLTPCCVGAPRRYDFKISQNRSCTQQSTYSSMCLRENIIHKPNTSTCRSIVRRTVTATAAVVRNWTKTSPSRYLHSNRILAQSEKDSQSNTANSGNIPVPDHNFSLGHRLGVNVPSVFHQAQRNQFFARVKEIAHGDGPLTQFAQTLDRGPSNAQSSVFANSDLALNHIDVYGFDYDYTLASYTHELNHFIYDKCLEYLVTNMGYPEMMCKMRWDPSFAVRGLVYDKSTGYMMKLDQYYKLQPESVHYGRHRVSLPTVLSKYPGLRISSEHLKTNCAMYTDLFCLSEIGLLCDVIQFFLDQNIRFSPDYVFGDVRRAVNHVHADGILHNEIMQNPEPYLHSSPHLAPYLESLANANKKLFLLTNSSFKFVDAGMKFLMRDYLEKSGRNWIDMFDIVMTSAKKPYWYSESPSRRFRKLNQNTGHMSVDGVNSLRRGEVYTEGSLSEFQRLSKFDGTRTLYMGDHIYADLLEPQKTAKWKTAAIIRELRHETKVMDSSEFQATLAQLLEVEDLIQCGQDIEDGVVQDEVAKLKAMRDRLRHSLRDMVNPYFGSIFRTSNNRTLFNFNVGRFADVFTGGVQNFMNYPLTHCFYSGRIYFPHEIAYPSRRVVQALLNHGESNMGGMS